MSAIRDELKAKQLIDFSGLKTNGVGVTDLDGLIATGRCFVMIEVKHQRGTLHGAQRTALERMCDDLGRVKPTVLIVGIHAQEAEQTVDMSAATVAEYRFRGKWYTPRRRLSVVELRDEFIARQG